MYETNGIVYIRFRFIRFYYIYISRNGIRYKETKLSISHVRNLIPFL